MIFSENAIAAFTPELLTIIAATISLPIIGAFILWQFAHRIAEKIHPEEALIAKVNGIDIVSAGIFLIAIWLLIKHLGAFVNYYISLHQIDYQSLFMVIVGLILLFQPTLFTKLYKKVARH